MRSPTWNEWVSIPEKFRTSQMQRSADLLNDKPDRYIPTLHDGVKLQCVLDAILESNEKRAWIDLT